MSKEKIIVRIDGGARGNPGPAALGVVLEGMGKRKEYASFLGEKTNNEAEYCALIFALKKINAVFGKKKVQEATIEIFTDSELLEKQMRGKYKVKNTKIQKLFLTAWNQKVEFPNISFHLVPRELNKEADRLVNVALNEELGQKHLL